jgi:hypothetical protein
MRTTRRTRSKTEFARRLSRAQAADLDAQHECVERQRRAFAQGDRSLQELLRARRALLALRPPDGARSNWINRKFGKNPELAKANEIALKTGYNFADTTEVFTTHYTVKKAKIAPGKYRKITGNEATAIGFIAASQLAGARCSTVRIRSRRRPTFCTSWRVTRVSA